MKEYTQLLKRKIKKQHKIIIKNHHSYIKGWCFFYYKKILINSILTIKFYSDNIVRNLTNKILEGGKISGG